MKSIRRRVFYNFLIIIIISIVILDVLLAIVIKNYYYDNSEKVLKNQITTATSIYSKCFSSTSLKENIYDNVDSFWNQTDAEVQIYDANGRLIMDSIGVNESRSNSQDIKNALNGKISRWTGNVCYYKKKVMAVSAPITVDNKIIGVLSYIISLDSVNKEIFNMIIKFIVISLFVLVFGIIMSSILAKSIINPIKKVTDVANEMASGNLNVRSSIKDKDEVGKLALTLNYMAEELEKRDKLKDEFISSVSHELRTPLTAIKGWVITLQDNKTDRETLKTGLSIIEKESDRLEGMVEELLDFSRLQNGKIRLNKKDVNINEFVNYIEVYMSQRANREGKKLIINLDYNVNSIFIDPDRMKQVILNLIDNAFRFTEKNGEINFEVKNDNGNILFIVKDNGCGIPEEDLPKVKEKFYKGKNAKSQNGIGLSICDEIVKLHEGNLMIESKEGLGTIVIVELPEERR